MKDGVGAMYAVLTLPIVFVGIIVGLLIQPFLVGLSQGCSLAMELVSIDDDDE